MLPEGWIRKKVADLFDVQLGKMLNQDAKMQNPQYEYLGNSDIQWGKINTGNLKTMYFSVKELQKFNIEFGDVLMCEGGEVGRCAIWRNNKLNVFYQKAIHRLRVKGKIIPEYFYEYMTNIAGTKLLDDFTTKTSIAHLTREKLLELPVVLPPLPEQKKIAQILSTWDKAITATEQLIANSQQQKKALMQQLLTGKKRLLDDNGVRFSGEWEHSTLRNILTVSKGQQLNKDTLDSTGLYPVINGGITPSGYTDQKNRSANTITISEGGNSCGYVAFQTKDFWCGGHCYSATNLKLNLKFTYHCLKFNENRIMKLRVGSGLPNIQKKDIDGLVIKYPNCHIEQQKIAAVLSLTDREIEALQGKLTALKQEKKALMQQLLTGKRRVLV